MKSLDLQTASYDYELPANLIAERALEKRDESKLLIYDEARDQVIHETFKNIHQYLPAESMIILNQSKVFPCRFMAHKETGGKVEVFVLSLMPLSGKYEVLLRSSGKKNIGDEYFCDDLIFKLVDKKDESFLVEINLSHEQFIHKLDQLGQIPIPPYIRDGIADEKDKEQYQTIYAKELGSVAAPTAGLHFTNEVFENLRAKNIEKEFVTLHVGVGTFRPVKTDNILEHQMHSETFEVQSAVVDKLNQKKDQVFAVGTTSLRVLESIFDENEFKDRGVSDTDIFLYPGKPVKSIKGLITNFHLPKSTLIMLVSSILGREKTLELYKIAVDNKYRFFSYGDSMLILRDPKKVDEARQ